MKPYRLGLVIGKFAPLHLGHLALIDHASCLSDRVLVLSWSNPELPGFGPELRRRWLADCCPQHEVVVFDGAGAPPNDAPDVQHQQHLAALLRQLDRRPDAMFASEPYVFPCATVLAEAQGHPVRPEMFDPRRLQVPVSGTRVRERPGEMLRWLPPAVRADVVPRVVLLGGESTGKTTLAAALAVRFGGTPVAEYGRERWEAQGGRLDEADLLAIAREQVRREDLAARSADPVLVCDTSPLTTFGYAHWNHGRADPALAELAERRYTLSVLCGDEIPFDQDGTRRDASFRARQQAWYRDQLAARGDRHVEVRGTVPARVEQVERALAAL